MDYLCMNKGFFPNYYWARQVKDRVEDAKKSRVEWWQRKAIPSHLHWQYWIARGTWVQYMICSHIRRIAQNMYIYLCCGMRWKWEASRPIIIYQGEVARLDRGEAGALASYRVSRDALLPLFNYCLTLIYQNTPQQVQRRKSLVEKMKRPKCLLGRAKEREY